jgi:hypothetical protein
MDRRGRRDTRKAADGLAFWHELVIAVFGRGERPALQAEAERLAAELEAARQQARPFARCAACPDTRQRNAIALSRFSAPAALLAAPRRSPPALSEHPPSNASPWRVAGARE